MPAKYSITRHPRYTALLAVVLIATVFVFSQGSSNVESYFSRGDSLKWRIIEEDERYDKLLIDREAMVRKWGPTPALVEAFPPRDDFYTLWDFFIPAFQCPHRVERVGVLGDGGKWVCGLDRIARQKECVIYSFGVNNESSFEAELLRRAPGCQVWGYDFSVPSFGPEITAVPALRDRSHFHAWALGEVDNHGPGVYPPTYSLSTLMALNGHQFIDILKVDIEGAEFTALSSFLSVQTAMQGTEPHNPHAPPSSPNNAAHPAAPLPIGQMQIEIHARSDTGYSTFAPFKSWWESLERAGLRPFFTEPNLVYVNLIRGARPDLAEYSFMNIRGHHALVSDDYL
ncbi:uncharacterized protein FIBRA_00192 [Fibroporia radiculosa]|uniref:Methyltransferase domain-containing protein n=1 Tax=Fibroporia radiculosa TaxID=599839 RepID=J7SCL0_9APHY|nr:uncharacterized protein FIBRA_00192 [Fibroporia radiculosa]CCL98198.1 predicted protein [Fibroporia radiculosa]